MRHLVCLCLCLLLCGCAAGQEPAAPPPETTACVTEATGPAGPDYEALARCSLYAQDLGRKYGMEILVYLEAAEAAPWDYTLEPEKDPLLLMDALTGLEQQLRRYPEEILSSFSGLRIALVRRISGIPGTGSPEQAGGIQFRDGDDTYVVLATGRDPEAALCHELWHIMEPAVFSRSTACDQWEALNPEDFRYDNAYDQALPSHYNAYLQPGSEYFIDTYSMHYAAEDRARIMEYAMLPGQDHRFRSPYLQAKLYQLCLGIREAFPPENPGTALPWEQYLTSPLS